MAIMSMISNGEFEIDKILCIGADSKLMYPCGVCTEFMYQLDISGNTEVLEDILSKKSVKIKELLPNWWGNNKLK